jgi:hypothetical protein
MLHSSRIITQLTTPPTNQHQHHKAVVRMIEEQEEVLRPTVDSDHTGSAPITDAR